MGPRNSAQFQAKNLSRIQNFWLTNRLRRFILNIRKLFLSQTKGVENHIF